MTNRYAMLIHGKFHSLNGKRLRYKVQIKFVFELKERKFKEESFDITGAWMKKVTACRFAVGAFDGVILV